MFSVNDVCLFLMTFSFFHTDDSWNDGVEVLLHLIQHNYITEAKKKMAHSLIESAAKGDNDFHKKYTNLFSGYAASLSQCASTSDETTADGHGNLHYVAAACIFRVTKQLRKEIEKNLYSPDRLLLSSLLSQLKTLEYLTVSEVASQKSSLDPESRRVTSFRQNSNCPLLNITDSSSSFF